MTCNIIQKEKNMDKNSETSVAFTAAFIILLILALTLCGCSTKKTVVETIVSHDTLVVHHHDTLRITHTATVHDTLREKEIHTYTLSLKGDTLKEVHDHQSITKVIIVDSTERYKALVDSLKKALVSQSNK